MFLGLDLVTWALVVVGLLIATAIYVRRIKREGTPQYAPAAPSQKALSVALLAAMLAAWAVYFSGWGLFGGYEKQVAVVVQLVCVLYVIRLTAILERP